MERDAGSYPAIKDLKSAFRILYSQKTAPALSRYLTLAMNKGYSSYGRNPAACATVLTSPIGHSFLVKFASYPLLHPDLEKATRKGQEHFLAPSSIVAFLVP